MQEHFSVFLKESKSKINELIETLKKRFMFISVFGTDIAGTRYDVSKYECSIQESMWSGRGFVVRVYRDGFYSEYSFNDLPDQIQDLANRIEAQKILPIARYAFPLYEETVLKKSFSANVQIRPYEWAVSDYVRILQQMLEKGMQYSPWIVDLQLSLEEVRWSKIYISEHRELTQDYTTVQGYTIPLVRKEEKTKYAFRGFARMCGLEIIENMQKELEPTISEALMLLDSETIVPGDYEVICAPEIAGLIAHEAFGHGVEMDMFVKNRAKSKEYLGKRVGSDWVYMNDGAQALPGQVASFLFDDEGVLGSDTVIIEKGMLKTGISDVLSALRLNIPFTGNGRRESYERKVYTRMTNTFFKPGPHDLQEMIRSIQYGVLLEKMASGMEDPKNWGIQCMIHYGHEIRHGKLTGKIFSPIIMTGYVPDLLSDISMVSNDFEAFGAGACGKGYKEFVKVSDGGPYLKTKARLG